MDKTLTPEDMAKLMQAAYLEKDAQLRAEYDRSLPFQDAMFDRWERARRLGFGEDASIYNSSLVMGDVKVGDHSWVGPYTFLDGSGGGLKIGAYCSISSGVHIYTHDTVLWALSGGAVAKREGKVEIGDCTYIGSQSVIAAGVKIGTRCVVAANSFVNRDVPDGIIVGGSPAREIGVVTGEGDEVSLAFGPKD